MTATIATLIQAARDTLDEQNQYATGETRQPNSLSFSNTKLCRYAQRALGEKMQTSPAYFYQQPAYNPFQFALQNEEQTQEFMRQNFPIATRHLHEIAVRICVIAQMEGSEIASPQQAAVLAEEAAAADAGAP